MFFWYYYYHFCDDVIAFKHKQISDKSYFYFCCAFFDTFSWITEVKNISVINTMIKCSDARHRIFLISYRKNIMIRDVQAQTAFRLNFWVFFFLLPNCFYGIFSWPAYWFLFNASCPRFNNLLSIFVAFSTIDEGPIHFCCSFKLLFLLYYFISIFVSVAF